MYWLAVGRAPSVSPDQARQALEKESPAALLVDVRTKEEYASGHLDGSYHWPLDQIQALKPGAALPTALQNKELYLICRAGVRSAQAALILADYPLGAVYSVQGGYQSWTKAARTPCGLSMCKLKQADGSRTPLPYRESSLIEQWAVTITAFGVKPLYMLLALVVILLLRRSADKDLMALKYAMIAFLAGEGFCTLNFLFFDEGSYLIEYLHGLGMVLAFGLTTFSLFEGIDTRLLKVSAMDKRCTVLSLCSVCIKKDPDAACAAQQLAQYFLVMCMIVCLMPLTVVIRDVAYNTTILGTPYTHVHATVFQLFELRYAPLASLLLYFVSLLVLRYGKSNHILLSKWLFAYGTGFLSFGFFRMIVYSAYLERLGWYTVWEEMLELLYIASCVVVVWSFRKRLLVFAPTTGHGAVS